MRASSRNRSSSSPLSGHSSVIYTEHRGKYQIIKRKDLVTATCRLLADANTVLLETDGLRIYRLFVKPLLNNGSTLSYGHA